MGKFDDIPTEPLFPEEPYKSRKRKPKGIRSVAHGNCPFCLAEKMGLLRVGNHLVWRNHTKRTWSGTPMECMASGVSACVAPEREPLNPREPVRCPHK